jgi:hypothetical protein
MRKYQMSLGVFITSLILFTGFKKNPGQQNILTEKSADTNNHVGIFTEPVKVSIADVTAIKGDKGQRPVKVMVYLSQATTEPVTVKYSTENGSAKAGVDYVATNGSITFQPGEVAKWITVLIIGEVAADPDEDAPANSVAGFIIKITQATGAIIDMARAYITIIQNIAGNPSIIGGGGNQAVYEVIISFTGYTSFFVTAAECGIRSDGVVVLSGLLSGIENVASDDDITYTGNLEMIIDIDICSIHQLPNGEDRFCGIRVDGSGTVYTELEIHYDSDSTGGRGGYIKIENKDGRFRRVVTGECGEQVNEEWTMVPNKSIASVFNGKELPMLKTRTLRKGIYEETDEQGNKTVVEVLRKLR